ncbi:DNA polymerase III subunit epsilon [Stenotrophomonas pictorum JCM 9942]|uniref:DNA polymerase III subunit epsilon n=1 Tax=Stenotrophomonas pictorum JCM 9942 TaxID=1236960 RepID=A0A0R0AEN8_9GAMM|nr:DNA polymerase III subunit epsilon [Stenotrophomonas pictorum]KRG43488.1 DNA polymerase III subunit epsilon [Stenotrophomonas pictorum JCM 9942]
MRQIILDTETTGLDWKKGNRVVEIGCVELLERRPSGNNFHRYLKPDCEFESGAQEVTGLTLEFLADKPRFEEVVDEFLAYVDGAELIIHNASFDMGFLENELALAGKTRLAERVTVTDTLLMARERYPGQRNSLDALCRRLGVDNSHRQLHGALLDAQILADVYIALTSGQEEIGFGQPEAERSGAVGAVQAFDPAVLLPRPRVLATGSELEAHEARLARLRKKAGHAWWDGERAPVAPETA